MRAIPKLLQIAEHLRGLLAEADDADSELIVNPATRRRNRGATVGIEVLAGRRRV